LGWEALAAQRFPAAQSISPAQNRKILLKFAASRVSGRFEFRHPEYRPGALAGDAVVPYRTLLRINRR